MDKKPAERQLGRVLGAVWQRCNAHLDNNDLWVQGLHMGTFQGCLFLKKDGELYEPLRVLTDRKPDSLQVKGVKLNEHGMEAWQLSRADVLAWVQGAMENEGLPCPTL